MALDAIAAGYIFETANVTKKNVGYVSVAAEILQMVICHFYAYLFIYRTK